MHVLYSFNLVEMASRDLQIWLSKLCMAAQVMALRRLMSQVLPLWVNKRAKVDKLNYYDVLAVNLNG